MADKLAGLSRQTSNDFIRCIVQDKLDAVECLMKFGRSDPLVKVKDKNYTILYANHSISLLKAIVKAGKPNKLYWQNGNPVWEIYF